MSPARIPTYTGPGPLQQNTTLNNENNNTIHNHIKLTSMKIAHSNINGLRNKIDDISVNLSDFDETFSNIITELADLSIPKVSFTYQPNDKPWMNNNIRRIMRQRDRLFLKAKNKNTE